MKVGTDAMLFGSLAEFEGKGRALDIGTGTGVLSLMLAQRFPELEIDALEIDLPAFEEAQSNVENSPFSGRIRVLPGDFTQYPFPGKYELIFSNPPYFEKAFLSGNEQKDRARHTQSLDFSVLFQKAASLLSDSGEFQLILPHSTREQIIALASGHHLFLRKVITIFGKEKQAVRCIFFFSKSGNSSLEENLTVRENDGDYTQAYKNLTREFHYNSL